ITEGNGSIAYFARGGTSCNGSVCTISYTSPKGDFTTFKKDSTVGGTCTPPCPTYESAYAGAGTIWFDANLREFSRLGFRAFGFRHMHFRPPHGSFVSNLEAGAIARQRVPVIYVAKATLGYNASNLLVAI